MSKKDFDDLKKYYDKLLEKGVIDNAEYKRSIERLKKWCNHDTR